MNNSKKTVSVLQQFLTVFPSTREIDAAGWRIYAAALDDIPHEKQEKAMMALVKTSKYFPTVAEIREAVAAIPPTPEEIAAKEAERAAIKKKRDDEQAEYFARKWGRRS